MTVSNEFMERYMAKLNGAASSFVQDRTIENACPKCGSSLTDASCTRGNYLFLWCNNLDCDYEINNSNGDLKIEKGD